MLWRAIRRIVPADQQTDWELFAYCRLVPRGLHVRELPPEAYFLCTRRTQAWQRLVIAMICLIPFGILAYWIPYQAAIMSVMMLVVNAGFALLMDRETPPKERPESGCGGSCGIPVRSGPRQVWPSCLQR